jgi:diguanylate cyclase
MCGITQSPLGLQWGMKKFPLWLTSLKFRLVAVVVATGLLTAVGTSGLIMHSTEAELRAQMLVGDRDEAERTADLLGGKVDTLKRALVAVAQRSAEWAWLDQAAMEQYLLDKPALNSMFDGVLAIAPDGANLVRMEAGKVSPQRPNLADRTYFQEAMRGDQPVVSEPLRGKVTGQPLAVMAVPVIAADGTRRGVLAGVVRLQSNSLFTAGGVHTRSVGTLNMVLDRQGTVLAHPDASQLLTSAAAHPAVAATVQRWRDDGSPIDTDGKAELTEGHLVTIAGIPGSDWLLVRVTPEALALQPLEAARSAAWRAAAAAGALAALLAGAVAIWTLRPVERLRQRALRLAAGGEHGLDQDQQPWQHGNNEVGDMGRAFEHLLSERRQQQAQMRTLLTQVESVLDHADVGIALTINSHFVRVSRQFCDLFACQRADLLDQPSSAIHANEDAYRAFSDRARPALTVSGSFEAEVELMRRDGQPFWARMRGRAVVPGDRTAGTIWVVEDVTDERHERVSLTWAANHDALTGLLNRAAFETRLQATVADPREHPFCALFIDLDRFKQVNDTAGHAAGDAVLRGVSAALSGGLRRNDVVARLGGDEFAVLLPRCPVAQGLLIGEKLRAAVEAYSLDWQGQAHQVGASIGLTLGTGQHTSAAEVLRLADANCYAAKRGGRNQLAYAEEPVA